MTAQDQNPEAEQGKSPPGDDQTRRYQRGRFPEPKAWALNWETLPREETTGRANGRFDLESKSQIGGGRWNKFPQPRGWALQWDGHSIDAQQANLDGEPWTPEDAPSEGKNLVP